MSNHINAGDLESPFLSDIPLPGAVSAAVISPARAFAPPPRFESPFVAEYDGGVGGISPHAETFAALVDELYDPEFDEALEDLVDEAAALVEQDASYEFADPGHQRVENERIVRDFLTPLAHRADAALGQLETLLAGTDLSSVSEAELDALFEQAAVTSGLSPTFENFVGGLMKKARKAIGKAKSVVGKVLPHNLILGRLKGLVKPLLDRVLRMAVDKLPTAIQPIARQLAKRLLNAGDAGGGLQEVEEYEELASPDATAIQEEFDTQIAGLLTAGEDVERGLAIEASMADRMGADRDAIRQLEARRAAFARRIVALDEGADPRPVVEEFVPAILGALRLGIQVIGRPRVVKFLAGLVAQQIARYVGKTQAPALSTALVDTGLRLVSLEAEHAGAEEAAGYALASTVEDTVNRLVQAAPAEAWENDTLLEAYAREAFQQAAVAHFPDTMIREDLHETAQASGAWVALPAAGARKRYKKYSRVLDVTITPQIAAAVKTFGQASLKDFLRDRLGVSLDRPVRVRVHLYEAIPGTRLSLVAYHEKGVSGLGSASRGAWTLFHPLTSEAAGLLLKEPGLGQRPSAIAGARRGRLVLGQRFYYLEIPGARVRLARSSTGASLRPARSTHTHVALDFLKREVRIALFYSEADAQALARQLRQRAPASALLTALKARHDRAFAQILTGNAGSALRIVHETAPLPSGALAALQPVLRAVGEQLGGVVLKWTLQALQAEIEARYDRFVAAVEDAARADVDGITIRIVVKAPPLLDPLRRLLTNAGATAAAQVLAAVALQTALDTSVSLHPGLAIA